MTIREFVEKHGQYYKIKYGTIHRLIRLGALKENIHYQKSHRAVRSSILLNEYKVLQYLQTGRAQ